MAHGNFPAPWYQPREKGGQAIVVAKPPLLDEHHDRHGDERLGDRTQIKRTVRRDRPLRFHVREAVTLAASDLAVIDGKERGARMLRLLHIGKDGIDAVNQSRTQVHSGCYRFPLQASELPATSK